MPSNKETLFQKYICDFLEKEHGYQRLSKEELPENDHHIIPEHLIAFIKATQPEKYEKLKKNYGTDAGREIISALKDEIKSAPLWLAMRNGITVRGIAFELYKPKPRAGTEKQWEDYRNNIFSLKKEYRYNPKTSERIDLVIWLNGLPIIVCEMKHEDERQNIEDAVRSTFLNRDLENNIYKLPFLFLALTDTEAKAATNLRSADSFMWFNADLVNKAETEGEYPVEHVYRHALSKENIAKYLEHYLIFVPPDEEVLEDGGILKRESQTIFPRYHQLRASKKIQQKVGDYYEANQELGIKYLINHSAGSGKTLTIAWMADLLDSLYTDNGKKVFDNIIILTDRRALDKNVRDELDRFSHLKETKINIAEKSKDLAKYLDNDRDIIVSTIHKFSYIHEKLNENDKLKNRKVGFLIDEAHRSQDGKLALTMQQHFTEDEQEDEELEKLNISNQVYVAFTATTTPRTASFFGEPVDTYSEEEAIAEGYILDVAQSIISYKTLYHLKANSALPEKTFPKGTVSQALKRLAFEDDSLIQYKSEVIVKMYEEEVLGSVEGRGKAMVVANSRKAGLKYFQNLKSILDEKGYSPGVLYAFSDFTDDETGEKIEEEKINRLKTKHSGKEIEDVFDTDDYRIMVVANKFQTGFDQPLLTAMFLDKPVRNTNAIQTVSRLNRKHKDKDQSDLLIVDFTNSADEIFDAFNKHRKGSPFKEKKPDKTLLDNVYKETLAFGVFNEEEMTDYVEQYEEAEIQARKRNSTPDAILSNVNQEYREQFKEKLDSADARKKYITLLNRYCKLYYFIARFFQIGDSLRNFSIFAKVMKVILPNKGRTSELKKHLKDIETEKIVVTQPEERTNEPTSDQIIKRGLKQGNGGNEPARSSINDMLDDIKEKFEIDEKEAIVIKEICNEVSEKEDVVIPITENRHNETYLKTRAKPKVQGEVTDGYVKREKWDELNDPMYIDDGGIISLMGNTIINNILMEKAS